jgi:hypothetical protein
MQDRAMHESAAISTENPQLSQHAGIHRLTPWKKGLFFRLDEISSQALGSKHYKILPVVDRRNFSQSKAPVKRGACKTHLARGGFSAFGAGFLLQAQKPTSGVG